eukprot:SAG31_NODE_1057_length_10129_cov_29.441376_8_plen_209_part_00
MHLPGRADSALCSCANLSLLLCGILTDTRGTWTTPEAVHPDRDVGSTDYVAAGVMTAPTYLKWALLFEEPDNRTVWLAKALPRDWLEPGTQPVVVENATSRYGRVSFSISAKLGAVGAKGRTRNDVQALYSISASVTLPSSYATAPPAGGVRLRLRPPLKYAGKLKAVKVGGAAWSDFDAQAETVDFAASKLTAKLLPALSSIVAIFS